MRAKMTKFNTLYFILSLKVLTVLFSAYALMGLPEKASACSTCSTYEQALKTQFNTHQNWMTNSWWNGNVEPAMKKLADEFRKAVVLETLTFGSYLDGQNLMGAQRALQESTVNTLKNYTPSDTICKFGTLSRSLALSESKGNANQLVLSKRSLNRQMGHTRMASSPGLQQDRGARLKQFQKDYCDSQDFGTGMKDMCTGSPSDARHNIDINYTRAVDTKNTLDIDLSDATATDDETDIIALANNLYAHKVFNRINSKDLEKANKKDLQSTYLDQRSIIAKRSVAENSFYEIIGQKSKGGTGSQTYFLKVLESLGLTATDAQKYVGAAPSYDAQMEVLTKKLYQDPAFYANLMDSPANVNRQYAALQSFGLMQKRDIFETVARSEMLMSLLLEMEISAYQDAIQNRQNSQ
jgi:hypothetical protein